MSITLLWAVDVYGRVYSLSTAGQQWVRADDMLLELKRVSAGKGRCWGIGCDHRVYLNIMPSETSIRYREETYENQVGPRLARPSSGGGLMLMFAWFRTFPPQRWNPVDGFTDALLPTDRWPWSDVTGLNPQPLHSFELPARSWEWEGDWYVDQCCGGEPSEDGVRARTRTQLSFIIFMRSFFPVIPPLPPPRAGNTLWISQPTSLQIRSGTRACAAGGGSATGDTRHRAPGPRFAQPPPSWVPRRSSSGNI